MADSNTLLNMWYRNKRPWLSRSLLPVSWLFLLLITLRRAWYRHVVRPKPLPVPVIVVGNINVGGSGKTPLLIALAARLRTTGYRPGIISRGYGGRAPHYPFAVEESTPVAVAGDEPLMIAQRSHCPVVVGADRVSAAKKLLDQYACDVILSDDGLQHYRLRRDLEIVVVDGERQLGNGRLMPAGPLREPAARLQQVNWLVVNGEMPGPAPTLAKLPRVNMQLQPSAWVRLWDGQRRGVEIRPWAQVAESSKVHALAGIGNPGRFFQTLEKLGVAHLPHPFSDHHNFNWRDIRFSDGLPVVMTEKDGVKCRELLKENGEHLSQSRSQLQSRYWMLAVEAKLDENFYAELIARLQTLARPT